MPGFPYNYETFKGGLLKISPFNNMSFNKIKADISKQKEMSDFSL